MAVAHRYDIDNPRITAILPLAADTVISLEDFIIDFCEDEANAELLFANETVANQAARLALTNINNGYIVFQTSNTTFYILRDETDIANNASWQAQETSQLITVQSFLKCLSQKVAVDSSIGNTNANLAANPAFVMNGWMNNIPPTSTAMTTYGVPLAVNTERSFSGHAKHYFLYSLLGTDILLDIVFVIGSS